jgi:hypothetical protein
LLVSISREAARFIRLHVVDPPESLVDAVRDGAFRDDRCEFECTPATAEALGSWLRLRAQATRPTDPGVAAILDEAAADIAVAIEREGP